MSLIYVHLKQLTDPWQIDCASRANIVVIALSVNERVVHVGCRQRANNTI